MQISKKINFVPKVAENVKDLEIIHDYVKDKIEIHLLSNDFSICAEKIEDYLKARELKLLIAHLPNLFTDWEVFLMNPPKKKELEDLVKKCVELSNKYNTEIRILGHMSVSYRVTAETPLKEWFKELVLLTGNSKVGFLVENSVTDPYKARYGESFLKFVRDFDNEKVRCCFDICHYNVLRSLLGDRYVQPDDLGKYTFSVHFSHFPMDKHVFDPDTHGIKHNDKDEIIIDLNLLEKFGIDYSKVYIVTEINETDYANRPDLLEELKNLTEINQSIKERI